MARMDAEGSSEEDEDFDAVGEAAEDAAAEAEAEAEAAMDGQDLESPAKVGLLSSGWCLEPAVNLQAARQHSGARLARQHPGVRLA